MIKISKGKCEFVSYTGRVIHATKRSDSQGVETTISYCHWRKKVSSLESPKGVQLYKTAVL